jgi:hypothetical protein
MISSLLPEHHRQGREHALVFSVEASLNFLSRPDLRIKRALRVAINIDFYRYDVKFDLIKT